MRLRVRNFRKLASLDWAPSGVCLLVGPNGAGKTTALRALQFMQTVWRRGMSHAIRLSGGARAMRTRGAAIDAPVELELAEGEVTWSLKLIVEGDGLHPYYGERVQSSGEILLNIPGLSPTYLLMDTKRGREDRPGIETLRTVTQDTRIEALNTFLSQIRVHTGWWIPDVLRPESAEEGNKTLNSSGRNLIPVLQSWKAAPRRNRDQFAWVLKQAIRAFPDVLADIEFAEDGSALLFPADSRSADDTLPLHLAPDGLIRGLLVLTAVAGAPDGSVVAIDDVEEALHPYAIRSILESVREWSDEHDLTVIFTTHSPIVMNEFSSEPDRVFVLEPNAAKKPIALDKLKNPDWLAMFSLGELYDRMKFASPPPPAQALTDGDERGGR
ncbi:MAG: AAA family ATPase [Deltaproteobacteria bacterium]|nr:AAA family ATPase [Deltaproteobacteria bacterium]